MKKILQYPVAVLFGVFILVFFLVDVLNQDRSYSEFENTVLTTRPAFRSAAFLTGVSAATMSSTSTTRLRAATIGSA